MFRLVASRQTRTRLTEAKAWIVERARTSHVLVVASTRGAADDFARAAVPKSGGLVGVFRMTLRQLARELATAHLADRGRTVARSLASIAIAARAAHAARSAGELCHFDAAARTPGFPTALLRTLLDLRLNRVSADHLRTIEGSTADRTIEAPALDAAIERSRLELSRLLDRYEEALLTHALSDDADLLEAAEAALHESCSRYASIPLLLLDVAPTCLAEESLLSALADPQREVLATLHLEDLEGLARLEHALGVEKAVLEDPGPPTSLSRLRTSMFSSATGPFAPSDSTVEVFGAGGQASEMLEIARRILAHAREGIPFDETAILLRQPGAYRPLIEEALRRAGIPAYFTQGVERPHPAGRAMLSLLTCASERLSAKRFAEYLSLSQVPPLDDEQERPVDRTVPWVDAKNEVQLVFASLGDEDEKRAETRAPVRPLDVAKERSRTVGAVRDPDRWERLLVEASIIGGKDRWAGRLAGLKQQRLAELRVAETADTDRAAFIREDIQSLDHLERFAQPIVDALSALPSQASWGQWLDALLDLAHRALAEPESVLKVLAELQPMRDVGPVGLFEVREVLTPRLRNERSAPSGHRYGKVFVGPIEEAKGRSFEVVFVPGLTEGAFPERVYEDPLFLDRAREATDPALAIRPRGRRRERQLLELAAGCAARRLVASYPTIDILEARSHVPSFYALEILRGAEGRLPNVRDLERRARANNAQRPGWSAPLRPDDAIDDAEYDLALASGLGRNDPAIMAARGRHLVEGREGGPPNAHLLRALRMQAARGRHRWTFADGLDVGSSGKADRVLEILASHRLSVRSYSPTALETFSACPYRFFLYAVLGLRAREEASPVQQLDPLTRGSLYHDVQFELFSALRSKDLLPVRADTASRVLSLLDEVVRDVSSRYLDRLAPAIPTVFARDVEDLRQDLVRALRLEMTRSQDWRPIHAELAFGLNELDHARDPASLRNPVLILGHFFVRGSIDLVEEHSSTHRLRVTDHKTGKMPAARPRYVGGGAHLQPLIYGLAVESALGRKVECGRLSYGTSRGKFDTIEIELSDDSLSALEQVFRTIDDALAAGFLPRAPREDACGGCDYQPVCGLSEARRVHRKDPSRLASLEGMRSLR